MLPLDRFVRTTNFLYQRWLESHRHGPDLKRIESIISTNEPTHPPDSSPVVFFNASTRTWGLSLNAAFSLLTSWGLRLGGVPVVHFFCMAGMEQCVLGTVRTRLRSAPPCSMCIRLSRQMYPKPKMYPFVAPQKGRDTYLELSDELTLTDLRQMEFNSLPIGEICYPSLQWVLRRHVVSDTPPIRGLYRKYLRAAIHVMHNFERLIKEIHPRAIVVFNGITFPEAVARQVALKNGIPVITHEVGVQPFSVFFTHGEATAYPIDIEEDFSLQPEEEKRLDEYLSERFRGEFSMAGIRFWPEIHGLDQALLDKMNSFQQTVAVFTNVVFDTSQVHANTVFPDMFAWFRQVVAYAQLHPETLFVIRAHPDELRPGKESQETVGKAIENYDALNLRNLVFIPPRQFIDSYELIQKSKLILVYNSSIGLEGTLLEKVVLSGGSSRYTRYPTVFFPTNPGEYFQLADRFLEVEDPTPPQDFVWHARRFMYYQHFLTSLDFSHYLRSNPRFPGYVRFTNFDPLALHPDSNLEIRIIMRGILEGVQMFYDRSSFRN